jgi:hypothetical protein
MGYHAGLMLRLSFDRMLIESEFINCNCKNVFIIIIIIIVLTL